MTAPGVYSPEQLQAHVEKVIASDGVDDSRAVEVMARAMRPVLERDNDIYWAAEYGRPTPQESLDALARAALGALRALEGE